jgi:hypothetical protein
MGFIKDANIRGNFHFVISFESHGLLLAERSATPDRISRDGRYDLSILFYCEQVLRLTPKSKSIERIAAVILTSGFKPYFRLHTLIKRGWHLEVCIP